MGGGSWSSSLYDDRQSSRAATGKSAFVYSSAVDSGAAPPVAHTAVDPLNMRVNPNGIKMRESRDSDAHPESLAIGVLFDVTGSMRQMPIVLQKKLGSLMNLLISKGYVEHPQILFGAIGDAFSDTAPLQVGQFESGIELDDDLGKLWLEGGGGGSRHESYELVPFFFARHTSIDCFEKRGVKGYLFTMGDEMPYDHVMRSHVSKVLGETIEADIPIEKVIEEVTQKYHYFHLLVPQGANYGADTRESWKHLLGERCLTLDNPESVAEAVALAIGLNEGVIDIDTGVDHLKSVGLDANAARAMGTALAPLAAKAALAKAGTASGLPATSGPGVTSL